MCILLRLASYAVQQREPSHRRHVVVKRLCDGSSRSHKVATCLVPATMQSVQIGLHRSAFHACEARLKEIGHVHCVAHVVFCRRHTTLVPVPTCYRPLGWLTPSRHHSHVHVCRSDHLGLSRHCRPERVGRLQCLKAGSHRQVGRGLSYLSGQSCLNLHRPVQIQFQLVSV